MSLFVQRERRESSGPEAGAAGSNRSRAATSKLHVAAAIACLMIGTLPGAAGAQQSTPQQAAKPQSTTASNPSDLPNEPEPVLTQPLYLRSTPRDFTIPRHHFPNPFAPYQSTTVPSPRGSNVTKLDDLVRDGKIYLSLDDAIQLAIEDNYDIAIQRYNLDIADTDILRTKSGLLFNGVNTGLVANTIGGTTSSLTSGGGPGGSSVGSGGAGAGASGLVLTTSGAGPQPYNLDPLLTGTVQTDRLAQPPAQSFQCNSTTSCITNSNTYDFAYTQGFLTGTQLAVTFNNSRTSGNSFNPTNPQLNSTFRVQATQHLLQGFGPRINGRFIIQAKNNRRIADSGFRQQVLYTINQVETIYWNLVTAYEDLQAKETSLQQSQKLASDERKQLQIGTVAPLDVVNADASVASDQQNLIISQSRLEYQQLIIKQAIARNLTDPKLTAAPVIPTDRVSLAETPEEKMSADDLVKQAITNRPEIEQAVVQLKNDEISLRGTRNGLLPVVDLYAYYGGAALGGAQGPNCTTFNPTTGTQVPCPPGTIPSVGYGTTFSNLFNNSNPDKGVGVNVTIPIRNRAAQAEQARSSLEYRQAQMRLEQLYVQIRIQVLNSQFAITNDRAQVQSAEAQRKYAAQSLDAEQKKYRLGASTTSLVLAQQRNLANAVDTALSAEATYAIDRAALGQILANTLDRYGISLTDAVTGNVSTEPNIPGLQPAKQLPEPQMPGQAQRLLQQEQQPGATQPDVMQPQQPDMTQPAQPAPPGTAPAGGAQPQGQARPQ